MKTVVLLCFVLLLVSACKDAPSKQEQAYFSISAFLKKEIVQHRIENITLLKTVQQKERTESKKINAPDWENELKPFLEADIDKPAWKNSFSVDSSVNDTIKFIRYKTKDQKIPVKLFRIQYIHEKIKTLFIKIEKSNSWFTLKQELTYTCDEGYSIHSEQQMTLSDISIYEIKGTLSHQHSSSAP